MIIWASFQAIPVSYRAANMYGFFSMMNDVNTLYLICVNFPRFGKRFDRVDF